MAEITIDYDGTDIERKVGKVTFVLRDLPDFGLLELEEPRVDQGELGSFPLGIPKPKPRQVSFIIEGRVDGDVTDDDEIHRHLKAGWGVLRRMFRPRDGYRALGVESYDTAGLPIRRELLCKPTVAPSFRMVFEGGRNVYGGRPSGFLRYLVTLEATWPWWRGPLRTIAFDTALASTYDLALDEDAERTSGWRIQIASAVQSPEIDSLQVGFDSGGVIYIETLQVPMTAYNVFDWWHTNPQDWYSYLTDGGTPEALVRWGNGQPATGSNGGRIGLDNTSVTLTVAGGSMAGTLSWYDWFEDYGS